MTVVALTLHSAFRAHRRTHDGRHAEQRRIEICRTAYTAHRLAVARTLRTRERCLRLAGAPPASDGRLSPASPLLPTLWAGAALPFHAAACARLGDWYVCPTLTIYAGTVLYVTPVSFRRALLPHALPAYRVAFTFIALAASHTLPPEAVTRAWTDYLGTGWEEMAWPAAASKRLSHGISMPPAWRLPRFCAPSSAHAPPVLC